MQNKIILIIVFFVTCSCNQNTSTKIKQVKTENSFYKNFISEFKDCNFDNFNYKKIHDYEYSKYDINSDSLSNLYFHYIDSSSIKILLGNKINYYKKDSFKYDFVTIGKQRKFNYWLICFRQQTPLLMHNFEYYFATFDTTGNLLSKIYVANSEGNELGDSIDFYLRKDTLSVYYTKIVYSQLENKKDEVLFRKNDNYIITKNGVLNKIIKTEILH